MKHYLIISVLLLIHKTALAGATWTREDVWLEEFGGTIQSVRD